MTYPVQGLSTQGGGNKQSPSESMRWTTALTCLPAVPPALDKTEHAEGLYKQSGARAPSWITSTPPPTSAVFTEHVAEEYPPRTTLSTRSDPRRSGHRGDLIPILQMWGQKVSGAKEELAAASLVCKLTPSSSKGGQQ